MGRDCGYDLHSVGPATAKISVLGLCPEGDKIVWVWVNHRAFGHTLRSGGREAYCTCLENRSLFTQTGGSNPSRSSKSARVAEWQTRGA